MLTTFGIILNINVAFLKEVEVVLSLLESQADLCSVFKETCL